MERATEKGDGKMRGGMKREGIPSFIGPARTGTHLNHGLLIKEGEKAVRWGGARNENLVRGVRGKK